MKWYVRACLLLGYGPIQLCCGARRFASEFRHACRYTWLELRIEHDSFKQHWRSAGQPDRGMPWTVDRDGRVYPNSRRVEIKARES